MKPRTNTLLVPLTALVLLGGTVAVTNSVHAQSKKTKSRSSQKKKSSSKTSKVTANGNRLPAGYGKIDLKDEQRAKIYKIQDTYKPKIAKLEKELADMRAKMNKDMEGVLTRTQKSALSKMRKSGSSSSKKSSTKKSKSRSTKSKSKKK